MTLKQILERAGKLYGFCERDRDTGMQMERAIRAAWKHGRAAGVKAERQRICDNIAEGRVPNFS